MKLGLCTDSHSVTRVGDTCLAGDMDINSALLAEVGSTLGVGAYARVASAFIASGVDLFSNPHAGVRQPIGLTDEHLALASKHGDVHTAVKWYFNWGPDQSVLSEDA